VADDLSKASQQGGATAGGGASRAGSLAQERFVRFAEADGQPIHLGCEPLVESWDRVDGAAQRRLAAYRADLRELIRPRLATLEGAVAVRLVVGAERLREGDLDNFLTPLAKALGDSRVCSYRAERSSTAPSALVLGPAHRRPTAAGEGWSFRAARTRSSASTEAWKHEVAEAIGRHADAERDHRLEVELALRVGPGRAWVNLWKPAIDALGGILGLVGARPWHPRDDRIVALSLHREVDNALVHTVELGVWWRRAESP
jgi:hypothetical protein